MTKTHLTEFLALIMVAVFFSHMVTVQATTCPDGSEPVLTLVGYICPDYETTSELHSDLSDGTTTDTSAPYFSTYSTTATTSTATATTTTTAGTTSTTYTTSTTDATVTPQTIYIVPEKPTIYTGEQVYFRAYISGVLQSGLRWVAGGGIFVNSFGDGVYTAPSYAGVFNITAYNPTTYNWATTSVTVLARETTVSGTSYATATTTTTTTTSTTATTTTSTTVPPYIYTPTYTNTDTPTATSTTSASTTNTYTTAHVSTSDTTNINTTVTSPEPTQAEYRTQVYRVIETISADSENKETPEEEIFLFNKDSNGDGISDYDSIYVYDIDPVKPSPTTAYEGRQISAGEKVLLGFDPKEKGLVKVVPEEPLTSEALVMEVYRVKNVTLTPDKKIAIKGRALPNSFVTVYIYSTPIIVTVKTDEEGEWQYLLDKELEDGTHEVYTATVNNTGKILAKSRQFTFVKTAEAATLNSPLGLDITAEKPSFLSQVNIYIIILVFGVVMVLSLIFIGTKEEPPQVNQSNTGV